MVLDACRLTDADKLRAARPEAGGVKFDWENTRENVPPGKIQESRGENFPPGKNCAGDFPPSATVVGEDQQVHLVLFA